MSNSLINIEKSIVSLRGTIEKLNDCDLYTQEGFMKFNELLGQLEWNVIENLNSRARNYLLDRMEKECG